MSGIFLESVSITRTVRNGAGQEIETEAYLTFSDHQPELEQGDLQMIIGETVEGLTYGKSK